MKIDVVLDRLAGPAKKALMDAGFRTLEELAKNTEPELLGLHGIGKSAMTVIKSTLKEYSLALKREH
jgi:DNA-directed RNA polymerase alpha subunit